MPYAASAIWISIRPASAPFLSLFPIKHYDQHLSHWIKPSDTYYDMLLLSKEKQAQRYVDWKRHYYGDLSPWNLPNFQKDGCQIQCAKKSREIL